MPTKPEIDTGNKIYIIVNGTLDDLRFHKALLKDADIVICADGGANHAKKIGIVPEYVIGDMDSIDPNVFEELNHNEATKVIIDKNQDTTDTELAIELAKTLKPAAITLLCAIGNRIDHTIANIICLNKTGDIKSCMVDSRNEIFLIDGDRIDIDRRFNGNVSVIPLTDFSGLFYTGLKWEVKDLDGRFGWLGICNRMTASKASISVAEGKVIVIKSSDG